jgi:hypothetical protein
MIVDAGQRALVEKPFAISRKEIEDIEALVKAGAPIYFSDFYLDVRSSPLLWACGRLGQQDWRFDTLEGIAHGPPGLEGLGELRRVEGQIMETYNLRRSPWLAREPHGGVILDMLIHPLVVLRYLFPEDSLRIMDVIKKYHKKGRPPGVYESDEPADDAAEAFTEVHAILKPRDLNVTLKVAKNYSRKARFFKISGSRGQLRQDYDEGHRLVIREQDAERSVTMNGDRSDLAVRGFARWLDGPPVEYGWKWNRWAVDQLLTIRDSQAPYGSSGAPAVRVPHADVDKASNASGPAKLGRRQFVFGVLTSLVGSIVLDVGKNIISKPVDDALKTQGFLQDPDPRRLELISSLVKAPRRLLLWPGTEHTYGRPVPTYLETGFPHDLRAISPFRTLCEGAVRVLNQEFLSETLRRTDTLLATGTFTSSNVARRVLPKWKQVASRLELIWDPTRFMPVVEVPYQLVELDRKPVRVISGMEGGRPAKKTPKGLVDARTRQLMYPSDEMPYVDRRGWLKSDFLLVSRLPSPGGGPDIVLISGGHGAGTQAIELLFNSSGLDLAELEGLVDVTRGARYYQFVLEVGDIDHAGSMSVAGRVRLARQAPPVVIESRIPGTIV